MSDGFSFIVKYAVTYCADCPHFQNAVERDYVRNYCLHDDREHTIIPDTVWVMDEIDPNCPERGKK
jgi:hypothetical protein